MSIYSVEIKDKNKKLEYYETVFPRLNEFYENNYKTVEINKVKANKYDALVEKMKDEIENNEWSTKEYDCDTADYKQSQAIGAWNVLIKIKQELIPEEE